MKNIIKSILILLVCSTSINAFSFDVKTLALVGKDKVGFINRTGKFVIKPVYDDAMPFKDGCAAVNNNGKWGFIDENGKVLETAEKKVISDKATVGI